MDDPASWPYSNYLEWIGEREGALVDREFVAQYPTGRRLPDELAASFRDCEV